jgi:hypothetical protein
MDSPLRPAIILAITLPVCYAIGNAYDKPIEGFVAGFVVNGLINGFIDYQSAQPSSST